ncbi:MAG: energy-coupling factor transporter ATPase [Clostridia bacterium]|nr:energy-coupling factor transporter ATPase [Clostridia bacterium]
MSIVINHLTFAYTQGGKPLAPTLKGLTFTIEEGSFLGIIGHTGSGKSTFVKHLNGLLSCEKGTVIVDGHDLSQKSERRTVRSLVGMVFQYPEYQLFAETVYEDVAFGPRNMKLDEAEIKTRVTNAMTMVGLDPERFSTRSPFELSGGERRRAAIAGVLAMQPKYLVLDEPMAGLDPLGRKEILSLLEKLRSESGCTIIMISHSMDDIANHATKVLVLEQGSVFLYDTPQIVFSNAEELQRIGLSVPSITKICIEMNRRGVAIPTSICTEDAFLHWFREGKAHA